LDIFISPGLDGLGCFSMNILPMLLSNSSSRRGVWDGDSAPAITASWLAINWHAHLAVNSSILDAQQQVGTEEPFIQ
jgi:hypothetical protein